MGRRIALLIATYEYQDPGLRQLTSPAHDAEALAEVLRDPAVAGFEVTTLLNQPHHVVGEAIGDFYRDRRGDDLALLYFTGHGLKDEEGRLHLAMSNSRRDSLLFTALSAEQIDRAIEGCVSRQKVLILDCCYSGAFGVRGTKGDTSVQALERFQGRGRTVLTASDATQYSFEGDQAHGHAAQSVFTRYLVEGLRDGSADLDGDGDITLDELYSYVHDRVVEEMPQQRPKRQDNVEGRTVIATNINWTLPGYLRNAVGSPLANDRLGALDGLAHLHRIGNERVRATVVEELRRLTDDDSRTVSGAAGERLRGLVVRPDADADAGEQEQASPPSQTAPTPAAPPPTPAPAAAPPQPRRRPQPSPAQPARTRAQTTPSPSAPPPSPDRPTPPPPKSAPARSLALPRSHRARLVIAGVTALAVAVTVISVILANSGGSSDTSSSDQPAENSAITPDKTLNRAGTQVEFSSDGKTLATDDGHAVGLWSGGTRPAATLSKQRLRGFSPDGKIVATQGAGGTTDGVEVRLRNVATGKTVTIHASGRNVVTAFSSDGKTLATASTVVAEESGRDVPVQVWNATDGTLRATLTGHTNGVGSMAFTPDGTLVTASTDGTVRLWNVTTKKTTKTLGGDNNGLAVYDMTLSADGKVIATWGGNDAIQLWNGANGKLIAILAGHDGGVFSADSEVFAYADDTGVQQWNISTGKAALTLSGAGGPIAFGPKRKTLAASALSSAPTVQLWDVTSGRVYASLPGGTDALTDLAFSEDGGILATADKKGTVRLWHVSPYS
ncbi:caspase, EACC1-associated type [Streptomyces fulvoviolaceus]|uniref:caspase, EACC1-associated type n=1 Tax=Streptomyces fulvoviolaceus TaxID=285535 RepID=UPI000693C909|nr:caspase family protein [Streptomyces fulvoviolaceus]